MADKPNEEEIQDLVDIEEYAKAGKKPPKAKKYRIRIDRDRFDVEKQHITGKELLDLVKKAPEQWRIYQKVRGQMQEVQPGETVDLGAEGVERFTTIERAQGDGEQGAVSRPPSAAAPRRAFRLPEEDEAYLDSLDLVWETVVETNVRWVLIHGHPMPEGYDHANVTMAIRIEGGYPPGALDMCYLFPPLARRDGKAIQSLSGQALEGETYQRWSRHYGWREGDDTLVSHHLRIKNWIAAELTR